MDLGRARYRQAHKMPPEKWDSAVLVFGIFIILVVVVIGVPA